MSNEDPSNIHTLPPSQEPEKYSTVVQNTQTEEASFSRSVHQIKFYRELSICRTFDEFVTKIQKILKDMNFDEYAFTRSAVSEEMPRPIITMPKEMNDIYFYEGLYEHDLTLKFATNDNDPIFHSAIEAYIDRAPFMTEAIIRNKEIFKLLKSYGYYDFYFIPLGAHNGNGRILLSVATKNENLSNFWLHVERCREALQLLAEAIDYIGTRKFPTFFLGKAESQEIIIHPKPLMLLNTLARHDLTLDQTADKIGISIHTADKHIAAVKKALGATTTTGAIYKAIKAGLIDCT